MEQIKDKIKELESKKEELLKSINSKKQIQESIQLEINDLATEFVKLDGALREFNSMLPKEEVKNG
jgi:chromosome segregation ATPase